MAKLDNKRSKRSIYRGYSFIDRAFINKLIDDTRAQVLVSYQVRYIILLSFFIFLVNMR